jgi:hypothetical protein
MSVELNNMRPIREEMFIRTARHIENTDQCMVTLPCHYKDKRVLIRVKDLGNDPRTETEIINQNS